MGLLVTNFSENEKLAEAIRRYYTLLHLTFATNIYKVFETPKSQIYRFIVQQIGGIQAAPLMASNVVVQVECQNCKGTSEVQANLETQQPLQAGRLPFPKDNKLACPHCKAVIDLSDVRRQIEAQSKKRIVD